VKDDVVDIGIGVFLAEVRGDVESVEEVEFGRWGGGGD